MPKSRHDQFIAFVSQFMEGSDATRDLKYHILQTSVSGGSNLQTYTLRIPTKFELYTLTHPVVVNGTRYEAGPQYQHQPMPDATDMPHRYNDACRPFRCIDNVTGDIISYSEVLSVVETEDDMIISIRVKYSRNGTVPYPVAKLSPVEEKTMEIKGLRYELERAFRKNQFLEKEIVVFKKKNARLSVKNFKLLQHIREQFIRNENKEDCPVCRCEISPEKLNISGCIHYTCTDCATNCNNKCPICREPFL